MKKSKRGPTSRYSIHTKRDLGYVYPSYQYQENQPVFSNIDRVELKSYYCIQYHGALTELTSLTFTQLKEYLQWYAEESEVAYKDIPQTI